MFDKAICIAKLNLGRIVELGAFLDKGELVTLPDGTQGRIVEPSYWCTSESSEPLANQLIRSGRIIKGQRMPIRVNHLRPLSGLLDEQEVKQIALNNV